MIKSMTGFGRGEYSDEISKVTVEIRSVNHRYLDIFVKMPRRYAFAEETIKAAIKERVHRRGRRGHGRQTSRRNGQCSR